MRGSATQHDIVAPTSLGEALRLLPEHRPFAGGTDLMVAFERGLLPYPKMVSIWQLPELRGIASTAPTSSSARSRPTPISSRRSR